VPALPFCILNCSSIAATEGWGCGGVKRRTTALHLEACSMMLRKTFVTAALRWRRYHRDQTSALGDVGGAWPTWAEQRAGRYLLCSKWRGRRRAWRAWWYGGAGVGRSLLRLLCLLSLLACAPTGACRRCRAAPAHACRSAAAYAMPALPPSRLPYLLPTHGERHVPSPLSAELPASPSGRYGAVSVSAWRAAVAGGRSTWEDAIAGLLPGCGCYLLR